MEEVEKKYVKMVAHEVYNYEIVGMSIEYLELLEDMDDWSFDDLILPYLNYLEYMDDVKEELKNYCDY